MKNKHDLTTDALYFADKEYISNSMIGDYLRSPEYYNEKHILKTVNFKVTPAMQMGSAVDCIVTEGMDEFYKQYTEGVLKKDDAELYAENKESGKVILTPANHKMALKMAAAVTRTPAYKELADGASKQPVMVGEIDGHKVKGKLDFLTIKNDVAYVTDLKTTTDTSTRRYQWHCLDFGYYRQMAMYKELVRQNFPQVTDIVCRHIVVTRDADCPQVKLYAFDPTRVDMELDVIKGTLNKICVLKDFQPYLPEWFDAELLGAASEEEEDVQDEEIIDL